MSTNAPRQRKSGGTTDGSDIERAALATIATAGLGDDRLPEWEVYERAAWATQDTIERLAEEVA